MMRRRSIGFAVILLLVAMLACKRKTPTRPDELPAPSQKMALPDLDKLPVSESGRRAVSDLANAQGFGGTAIGVAGTPTPAVSALRHIWTEPRATEAFLYVMKHGTTVGKLFALSGLYYSDPSAFSRELATMRSVKEKVPVLQNGCAPGGDPTPVSEIIEKPSAVRLTGPSDTLSAWSARNPGKNIEFDIAGGGYPASFRPYVPPSAPAPSASTN